MERKTMAQMLMETLDQPRIRTLEPDVRMLWLDIARMMQRNRISRLAGSPKQLHVRLRRSKSESHGDLETKITKLVEVGVLLRVGAAIVCPFLPK